MHFTPFCVPFKGTFEFTHFFNPTSYKDTHSGAIFIVPLQVCFSLPLTPFFSSILMPACGALLRAEIHSQFSRTISPPPPHFTRSCHQNYLLRSSKRDWAPHLSSSIVNRIHQNVILDITNSYYHLHHHPKTRIGSKRPWGIFRCRYSM